jgi:sarcosine oxidase delta subunit
MGNMKKLLLIEDAKASGEKLSAIHDAEKFTSFLLTITDTEGKVKTTFIHMYGCKRC